MELEAVWVSVGPRLPRQMLRCVAAGAWQLLRVTRALYTGAHFVWQRHRLWRCVYDACNRTDGTSHRFEGIYTLCQLRLVFLLLQQWQARSKRSISQ